MGIGRECVVCLWRVDLKPLAVRMCCCVVLEMWCGVFVKAYVGRCVQLGVVARACNPATWRLGVGISRVRGFCGWIVHVDRASTLSTAPIWSCCRRATVPGRLRRGAPAQGGNPAGKSPRVVR